jgi:hypothetical protein
MWLFFQEDEFPSTGGISLEKEGGVTESISKAVKDGLTDLKGQLNTLTQMEDKAMELQKTMGSGLVLGGEELRQKIENVYFEISKVGLQFKDATDVMGGLSKSVGRIIDPSEEVTTNMALLGKNVGIASEAMGILVGDFMNLTFSQEKSADLIKKITDDARKAGVNVKSTLEAVQKNLDKVSAYGFKNGIDGLAKMSIQAQQLRTTVEDIGAVQMGQTFWDPEKAIEAAAGMSTLGGSMSNLMNPFQLMNMGANNVEKLQESLIDLSASAFKVNETTGEVETNFVAQQRLKEQLTALGKGNEYEKFINLGREAAKQAKIIADINKSGLGELFTAEGGTFTEEDQRLIASMSEMKDGKISLKIPGIDSIPNLKDELTANPNRIKEALQKYQEQAQTDEKTIALKSLSSVDQIKIDTKIISQALLRGLKPEERTQVLEKVDQYIVQTSENIKEGTLNVGKGLTGRLTDSDFYRGIGDKMKTKSDESTEEGKKPTPKTIPDGLFDSPSSKIITSKGEIFNTLMEDQVLAAPMIKENFAKIKNFFGGIKEQQQEISSIINVEATKPKMFNPIEYMEKFGTSKETPKETVQKIEGSGTVNINVNISSSGDLASSLMSNRRFKNDLETEILNTLKNKELLMVKK